MKCQGLLSTVTVSLGAEWWEMVAVEVAPDGKFDMNRFFVINIVFIEFRV